MISFNFCISGFSDFDEFSIIAFDELGVDVELCFVIVVSHWLLMQLWPFLPPGPLVSFLFS